VPNSNSINRYFVGISSHLGAGLSSLTQVSGAQARYEAALADIESTRIALGEQPQADFAQAQVGQVRLAALVESLESSGNIARAWNRQFIAGRKTWLDVMNAVREQSQLESQIADAKSSQLLLTWRLAIVGRGLDSALAQVAGDSTQMRSFMMPEPNYVQTSADGEYAMPMVLYEGSQADAIGLRMALDIDPLNLGVGLGSVDRPASLKNLEGDL
jgi:hypothetical protein